MKKIKDFYYHKAKQENYPARSVYKIEEINKKYRIIKSGSKILDLGASPGSWTKYCSEKTGPRGSIVAVDKKGLEIQSFGNVVFVKEDIFNLNRESLEKICPSDGFDVVLSDLAPATTGIRSTDQARSMDLVAQAYKIAEMTLLAGGHFVCKIFQGADTKDFINAIKPRFSWVKTIKPAGSRKESFETYIVGYEYKG